VGISLVPGAQTFSVLRALRILRLLRVISVAPRLRRVVEGFITALPGMGSVFLLMAIIFYIGAVMATKLFAASFPEWFGDLGRSAYSLFQIMTLESWSMGIVRPVMEVYPYAWAFFVPFIMVTTFAVVNLLVGLIVNSMQEAHGAEELQKTDAYRDEVLARLKAIEARLEERERERPEDASQDSLTLRALYRAAKEHPGRDMKSFGPVLLLALCAILAACGSKFKTYDGPEVTRILVYKDSRTMYLMHHDTVRFGSSTSTSASSRWAEGGRGRRQDARGRLLHRPPQSQQRLPPVARHLLSAAAPRAAARELGQSAGGDIFIHGGPRRGIDRNGPDWTAGCIAVTNREMEDIYAMVRVGTPISIYP
jgi:hypothetical protein